MKEKRKFKDEMQVKLQVKVFEEENKSQKIHRI
jgi:hypothetical protein